MTLEEKVIAYKRLGKQLEELEEKRKALGKEILGAMTDKKMEVGAYRLSQYARFQISTPLEVARGLQATKMEETLDKDRLKELHGAGQVIEGVQLNTYVSITDKREPLP